MAAVVSMLVGLLGLFFVAYLAAKVLAKEPGNATMRQLSGYIYEGAMAFLWREYRAIGIFAVGGDRSWAGGRLADRDLLFDRRGMFARHGLGRNAHRHAREREDRPSRDARLQ